MRINFSLVYRENNEKQSDFNGRKKPKNSGKKKFSNNGKKKFSNAGKKDTMKNKRPGKTRRNNLRNRGKR